MVKISETPLKKQFLGESGSTKIDEHSISCLVSVLLNLCTTRDVKTKFIFRFRSLIVVGDLSSASDSDAAPAAPSGHSYGRTELEADFKALKSNPTTCRHQ